MKSSKSSGTTKTSQKCRCCTQPSNKFLELDAASKNCGDTDKTYKDVLYEIINIKVKYSLKIVHIPKYEYSTFIFIGLRQPRENINTKSLPQMFDTIE